mgnify:CR=1 FL=1
MADWMTEEERRRAGAGGAASDNPAPWSGGGGAPPYEVPAWSAGGGAPPGPAREPWQGGGAPPNFYTEPDPGQAGASGAAPIDYAAQLPARPALPAPVPSPAPGPPLPPPPARPAGGGYGGPARPQVSALDFVPKYSSLEDVKAAYDRGEVPWDEAFRQSALIRGKTPTGLDKGAAGLRENWEKLPGLEGRMVAGQLRQQQKGAEYEARQMRAEGMLADRAAEEQARLAAEDAERAVEAQQRRQDYDAAYKTRMVDIEKAQAELADAQVDPDRWMGQKGTGGQIAAAIAMGLGALGSSLGGGPNYAMQIIQSSIDRDIDAQKTNLANKRANLGDKRAGLAMLRDKLGDDDTAAAMMKAQAYDAVANKVKRMSTQLTGQKQRDAAGKLLGDVEAARGQVMLQMQAHAQMQAQQQAQAAAYGRAMAAQGQQPQWQKLDPQNEAKLVDVPGMTGLAPDGDTAKKLRAAWASNQDLQKTLGSLQELSTTGSTFSPADRARASILVQSARMQMKNVWQLGVLSESDNKLIENYIPDPMQWSTTGEDVKLNMARSLAQSQLGSQFQSVKLQPVVTQLGQDKRGNAVRQMALLPGTPTLAAPNVTPGAPPEAGSEGE